MSHFFAYLSRMKFIRRWGLMRNTQPENIQEHTARVAMIAHALAVIKNRFYHGQVDPARTAVLALYHDASEVLTGDLPTPVKYFNRDMKATYQKIETQAVKKLFDMLPEKLKKDYWSILIGDESEKEHRALVKAADKLCAYLKCLEEISAGNPEFSKAVQSLRKTVEAINLPEVGYFLDTFVPSFKLTLDELE